MKQENIRSAILIFPVITLFIAFYLLFNFTAIYSHEDAHKQIFAMYGIESEIDVYPNQYYMGFSGVTTPLPNQTLPVKEKYDLNYMNTLNEIYGYNVMNIGLAVLFGSFIIAFAILFHAQHPKMHYSIVRREYNN
jgi:hypothetical protein